MYGDNCKNSSCQFLHLAQPVASLNIKVQRCKYYPNCAKPDCTFLHINDISAPCRYGVACTNRINCPFLHDDDAASSLKWFAEKSHISERKFAADDALVAQVPIALAATSNQPI
jgi:hypothetical protein